MATNQAYLFLIFVCNGILIGFLFDFFRVLRKSFKTNNYITYAQDIIFWILTGISIIFSMYKFSDGNLRLYIFLGLGFGIVIYMLSLSKFIINMLVCIIKFFQKIFQKVINILKIPYSFGYKFIAKIIHFFTRKLQINSTKKIKKNTKKCKLFRGKSKQMENNNIGIV